MQSMMSITRISSNRLPPARMTPGERGQEICSLLALGLVRLRMWKRDLPIVKMDLPGFGGVRLAQFPGLSLEGDGALEAER